MDVVSVYNFILTLKQLVIELSFILLLNAENRA
jgi:hypothetical protein